MMKVMYQDIEVTFWQAIKILWYNECPRRAMGWEHKGPNCDHSGDAWFKVFRLD